LFASALQGLRAVFAKDVFDVGAFGFGLMSTMFGIGGVLGAVIAANLANRNVNKGLVVIACACVFYSGMVLYGLSPTYATTLVLEFVCGVGAASWSSTAFPLIQLSVAPEMRGRVMSLVFAILPGGFMGQLLAGVLADQIGARATVSLFGACALSMHLFGLAKGTFVREAAKVRYA
jgi:predicted MFS family arabinose efflux permease